MKEYPFICLHIPSFEPLATFRYDPGHVLDHPGTSQWVAMKGCMAGWKGCDQRPIGIPPQTTANPPRPGGGSVDLWGVRRGVYRRILHQCVTWTDSRSLQAVWLARNKGAELAVQARQRWHAAHIPFISPAYACPIHIPFMFHSYSTHIPFISPAYAYPIHIPLISHSYSIHTPFIFRSYPTAYERRMNRICQDMSWIIPERRKGLQ